MITLQTETAQIVDLLRVNIPIPEKQVLRRLGYPPGFDKVQGDMKLLVQHAFDIAPELMHPKVALRILDIDTCDEQKVTFKENPIVIENDKVAKMLRNASKGVFFMVTIGFMLEREMQKMISKGDMTEGMALDAIGSETTDAVADYLHHELLTQLAESNGFKITPRFSPGYGEWSLGIQKDILALCNGKAIGISLSDSCLMHPRKSVSAVLGLEG